MVDRARSADRIAAEIDTLSGPDFTLSDEAIRRYAYTEPYRRTLDHFTGALEALDFDVYEDPVGTLVARNRPAGEPVFGIGSHCDSNRNGGRYDGTMGVVTALEVCRLNAELGLDLPLQLISFLEEEGSGFGQMLLGSRIMQKSISVVVPPKAADVVPDVKSSHVVVPPKNISMCVCGSIAPGITILPLASITLSAVTSRELPSSATLPSSTKTSPK